VVGVRHEGTRNYSTLQGGHLVKIEHARAHESESNAPQDGIAPPMLVDALVTDNAQSVWVGGRIYVTVITEEHIRRPGARHSSRRGRFVPFVLALTIACTVLFFFVS